MRILLAAALLVPLLAGCADVRADDVRIEAFTATYDITGEIPGEDILRYVATVTFGDVIDYVDSDGVVRQGYLVAVDYGSYAWRACRTQAILGPDLELRRLMWGNGWNEQGECVHEQYDWPMADQAWPKVPAFGVGLNVNPPPDAKVQGQDVVVDNRTYHYDGALAPVSFPMGANVATRSSYTSVGLLAPLRAEEAFTPLPLLPMSGPGLPGGESPLPGMPFSLDDAIAYARANDATAGRLLDEGACVTSFHLHRYREAGLSDLPLALTPSDTEETAMSIHLANANEGAGFQLSYGRKAPLGERGFLGIESSAGPGGRMDCAQRLPVAALPEQEALIADRVPGQAWFLYGIWQTYGTSTPWFQLVADTDRGRLQVHGSQGLLESWHLARDSRIDP